MALKTAYLIFMLLQAYSKVIGKFDSFFFFDSYREQPHFESGNFSSHGSTSGLCLKTVCPNPWMCKFEEEQCNLQKEKKCTCVQRHRSEITQAFRRQLRKTAIPHKLQCYINEETFCQGIATVLGAQTAIHQSRFILQSTLWYIIKRTWHCLFLQPRRVVCATREN